MKNNEAFTSFLDTKYIPLESKFKLLLVVLIFLLPAVAYYFFFLQPNLTEIDQLAAQKSQLEQELRKVKMQARDLPKLESELAMVQREFDKKSALLPREKEIPQLLRDISALGTNAGLDFMQFRPLPSIPRDFYDDIPISINVRGPYHSVGFFFDRVSKLERIVSVSNIKMSTPKLEAGEMLLNSDCQLVTYQFTNKELPKQPTK